MKKRHYLSMEVDNKNVKIRNILNKDFLEVELYAVADHYPNRNNSAFTLESMKDALPTFKNKPVLGSFRYDDFQGHESNYVVDAESGEGYFDNSKPYDEVPLGLITESSKIEIVKGSDGANWIKVNGYLWVKYATKQILSLLRKRKGRTKVSIECEVLESHMDGKIEVIDKFNLLGVTILGSYKGFNGEKQEILEGIDGANMRVLNFSANPQFQERLAQLTFAVQELEIANKNILNQNINNQSNDSVEKESVENEKTEEIGFEAAESEDRKEKSPMFSEMTSKEKMQILNQFLQQKQDEWVYSWLCDFDDSYVYVRINESAFKIPYEIIYDESNEILDVFFDFENKERVVESWKTYSESQESATEFNKMEKENVVTMSEDRDLENNAQNEIQNFAENAGDNSEAIEAESGVVMVLEASDDNHEDDNHDDDHDDNDDDIHDDDVHDDNDDHEDNRDDDHDDDVHDDDDDDDNDHDDNHDDNRENHSAEREECSEESREECFENAEEKCASANCQFVKIGDDNLDINQLLERYTALSSDYVALNNNYSELNASFNSMKEEYAVLKNNAEKARIDSLVAFGENLVNAEFFSEEKKNIMKNSLKSNIENGSLNDENAIEDFAVNMFAMALYEAHKAEQINHVANNTNKTEFVQNIVKHTQEKSKLAQATEKLRNI